MYENTATYDYIYIVYILYCCVICAMFAVPIIFTVLRSIRQRYRNAMVWWIPIINIAYYVSRSRCGMGNKCQLNSWMGFFLVEQWRYNFKKSCMLLRNMYVWVLNRRFLHYMHRKEMFNSPSSIHYNAIQIISMKVRIFPSDILNSSRIPSSSPSYFGSASVADADVASLVRPFVSLSLSLHRSI